MENLVRKLKQDYPALTFVQGKLLCWSPGKKEIYYDPSGDVAGIYGVLHEIGHARLNHASYESDIDLLKKESAAWDEALRIAGEYSITLDKEHIQDCLDTYRDWLHKRSTCPECHSCGLQQDSHQYICLNCAHSWRVTASRFYRPYRLSETAA